MIPVRIFSADDLPINVNVNNGPTTLQVAAAAGPDWTPQTPSQNPAFHPGPATPGTLGIGINNVLLTPQSSTDYFITQIPLPKAVNWFSIQIYVFFRSDTSCSWLVLNNGQTISQAATL